MGLGYRETRKDNEPLRTSDNGTPLPLRGLEGPSEGGVSRRETETEAEKETERSQTRAQVVEQGLERPVSGQGRSVDWAFQMWARPWTQTGNVCVSRTQRAIPMCEEDVSA